MKIIQNAYERQLIKKIRKEMETNGLLTHLSLNSIKSQAADLLIKNKISMDFYKNVFSGGDMTHHWSEVNYNYIINF